MTLLSSVLGSVIGGGFSYLGAKAQAKAGERASERNIQAARENQQRAIAATGLESPLLTRRQNPSGGFTVSQPGDVDAASAQKIRAAGDIGRAENLNRFTTNYQPTLPNLSAAQGLIQSDINENRRAAGEAANTLIERDTRKFGGIGNTGASPATLDSLRNLFAGLQLGGGERALNLFQGARTSDINALQGQILANQPQAGIGASDPGSSLAALIAQSPQPRESAAYAGLPQIAIANAIGSFTEAQQREEYNKNFLDAIRGMAKQDPNVAVAGALTPYGILGGGLYNNAWDEQSNRGFLGGGA